MSEKKQVNVRFEGAVLEQLKELANSTGQSISDVLREAVNTTHWLQQQQKEGKRILLQGKNDQQPMQVVFR